MTELILTRGVPASGKTTWSKQHAKAYGYVRVNRDELRTELNVKHGENEPLVTKIQHSRVKELLRNNVPVIVDDTNLTARFVKEWLKLAQEQGAFVTFMDFPIGYEEACARDDGRFEGQVGHGVIKSFFDRFVKKGKLPEVPTLEVEVPRVFKPVVRDRNLPAAYIVDTDGTVALMDGRSPYDPTKYSTDKPNADVIALVNTLWEQGYTIIGVSGRDEDYREDTELWWRNYGVPFDEFYMRPSGDKRKDDIIKDELYEKHIAGRYNVMGVLDDRDRVVAMWRAKGLTVFQVADGDF